ncbi:Endonuclease domain-containing 1 protein [Labeo rohita]|uniref:Endonuclease domain-containing 1 protein n=1 Tax=Labeo rohita TaxID=84645 RepID=A0ABQ8LR39_LABRO|nr:endonuclease domain-containing 1 protein [Labeo rohita]KAI2653107.1 Endonuclease domain-containing 1 protein [Labeo rohita]
MHLFVVSVLLVLGFPLIVSEVVDSFGTCSEFFFNEQPPVIPGVLRNSVSQDNSCYKLICQKHKNAYRFATLYNTANKIPVFSAYKYTGNSAERVIPWMIEPQLEPLNTEMCEEPCINQTNTGDYRNTQNLTPGCLFPNSHAADEITAESTFTLTNAVPQCASFKNHSWRLVEENFRSIMHSHCRDKNNRENILAYVLTGAVPSPDKFLNDRVNIPSSMWTVFCCFDTKSETWLSQGHWAENKERNIANINAKPLETLQTFLQKQYGAGTKLFNDKCFSFFNATNRPIEDKKQEPLWSLFKKTPASP